MRFRVWGIKLVQLWTVACVPVLFWFLFRWYEQPEISALSLLRFFQPVLSWALPIYAVFSFVWIFLAKRGFYQARFSFYALIVIQLGFELFSAVADRSFGRIGIGLLLLAILVLIYRWLESRIDSAQINPRIRWFEGEPKALPHLQAKIRIHEAWYEASVRVLDRKGLFLLLKGWEHGVRELKVKTPLAFELRFRDKTIEGEGKMAALFWNVPLDQPRPGIGLQFLPKDLYHFSQYTALVESLKGEGYV